MSSNRYTATIKVPVYASWKCEHCGEINFAEGNIACSRTAYTSSWLPYKIRDAQDSASLCAQLEWAECAFEIIDDPNNSGAEMYDNFFLRNTKCTGCGSQPRWNASEAKFVHWTALAIPVALISGIAVIVKVTNIVAWWFFIASIIVAVWGLTRQKVYQKMMCQLPKKYTPVIGSLNPELIKYANKLGKTIPTPDECIAAVRGSNQRTDGLQPFIVAAGKKTSDNTSSIQVNFCRKCGTELRNNDDFCHLCGTEIIKM